MKFVRAIFPAVGMLISISGATQGAISPEEPASRTDLTVEPTMMRVVRYAEEMDTLPACYRVGRCSAYDLLRFRDRPNWLTRLAPEAPAEPPSIDYVWFLVPVTPAENILPKYRTASLVREEYRAVGEALDGKD